MPHAPPFFCDHLKQLLALLAAVDLRLVIL